MKIVPSLEALEPRIAPAALLPGGKSLTYTDVDGDKVILTLSKGVTESMVTFNTPFAQSGPQQLQKIDFAGHSELAGTDVTLRVLKAPGGDGLANLGELRASGLDLGRVTIAGDLGQITAGDNNATATLPAVKALTVQSLARYDTTTQAMGGDTRSDLTGGLGSLTVKGSLFGELNVLNAQPGDGKIGQITVGGSLVGGLKANSGQIYTADAVDRVVIGGDIRGGSALASGQLNVGGRIGSLILRGSLVGGSVAALSESTGSGVILAGRAPGADGAGIDRLYLGGVVRGGSGLLSGLVAVGTGMESHGDIGSLTIGKGIAGGPGAQSGRIFVHGDVKSALVLGDVRGGSGSLSGSLQATGHLVSGRITGTLEGGAGNSAGSLQGEEGIGTLTIGRDVRGGTHAGSDALITSAGRIEKLLVNGSLKATPGSGNDQFVSAREIGTLQVNGAIQGTAEARVLLEAKGGMEVPLALGHLAVKGNFEHATLVVGGGLGGQRVEEVLIGGDFLASRIAVSTKAGDDGQYGTNDDPLIDNLFSNAVGRIASLTVKGQAFGTFGGSDSYRILASAFGSVKIAGVKVPTPDVLDTIVDITLGPTQDLVLNYGVPLPL